MQDIHEVLDRRAVTPVFQPLVDIATGRILGYEALSRGPAGTPWESPATLFAAARVAGRESELDWICRAVAYRAALDAGFPPDLMLFVNMEPTAWRAGCPADLAPIVERARRRLRVVTEMTERAIAQDPAGLLAAVESCRTAGWGVALDDVGADPMSLAMLPFVHSDVVKLDMGLLRAPDDPNTARVVAAVYAYAESSGATVLAEGIETPRHLAAARTMGATVGQGWHYGRPGPLPEFTAPFTTGRTPALPMLSEARIGSTSGGLRLPGRPVDGDRTPFEVISAVRPVTRTTKSQLMPLSRHLEALAGDAEPPVLLACFQEARHFTPATMARFRRIAAHSPLVAALGAGLPVEPVPGVRGACLGDDRLRGEWNVILVGPHRAAALVARDLGDDGPDTERRFDFAITHDRALVIEAARSVLRHLAPVDTPILEALAV
ncbi:EAL domain-containing protein [Actinoplanes sp. DH11]|uniref:sensor domain-containing phosphodiesterase n=1 Tax=Actinoplanes sp. DH11 TaxID=2857011 RepID=UPI001E561E2B|nr:EAL domain-containing protein [Actinoplanes sp. DH11]